MKKFFTRIIIVIITGSLIGGSAFYFWKNKYVTAKSEPAPEANAEFRAEKSVAAANEGTKKISDGKAAIMNYIENNINRLSPEKPIRGSVWSPIKIWFIDDVNFYVDYKDDASSTRRILVNQSVSGPNSEYEILGFFVPGNNGWMLKTGKDMAGVLSLKLYEKDEQSNEWIAK